METMLFYVNSLLHMKLSVKETAMWVEHQLFISIIYKYFIHASYIESLKLSDFML